MPPPARPAGVLRWDEATWTDLAALDPARAIALLPVGAVEAHGPHLPLSTDVVIAKAMAVAGARRLAARGFTALLLPPLSYTAAPFAAAFPGTLSIRPETVEALLVDLAAALAARGLPLLGIANSHLDPAHLGALDAAAAAIRRQGRIGVAFPDLTRKPWALRLGEEFKSGACHAGRFEGSIVLAAAPHLVREETRRGLASNPASLSQAIRAGKATFAEAGGPAAYFGDPAAASAGEGRETIETLGAILEEAVLAELADA
jgi:creatinine amidohydrolase